MGAGACRYSIGRDGGGVDHATGIHYFACLYDRSGPDRVGTLFCTFKKAMPQPWRVCVVIDGDNIVWTQYLSSGQEKQKKKRISDIKKVYRTKYCYYLIYNDISNAIICERCLLKRGTFDSFEMLFEGKIRSKTIE